MAIKTYRLYRKRQTVNHTDEKKLGGKFYKCNLNITYWFINFYIY